MIFIILVLSFLFFSQKTYAYPAIIIEKSIHSPPVGTGADQNFVPNDINNTDTIKCSGTYTVSETFNPKSIGSSPPSFEPYSVNSISNQANFGISNYSNTGLVKQQQHLGNRYQNLTDPLKLNKAFLSLNINQDSGNTSNRATPYYVLKCLKGQRLIKSVLSLSKSYNGTTCNEQIGWNCQNTFVNLNDSHDPSCVAVRIADIAAHFAHKPIFYPLDANCYDQNLQPTLLNIVHNLAPPKFSESVYQHLLTYAVEVSDTCSLARNIEICDKDGQGNSINCRLQSSSIPRGSIVDTTKKITAQFIPSSATLIKPDICQTTTGKASFDRPNPVSFLASVQKAFGTITDSPQTFSDTVVKNDYLDSRIDFSNDLTFLTNMIPSSQKSKYNLTSCSTTDGKSIDPGCKDARVVVGHFLLPKNF